MKITTDALVAALRKERDELEAECKRLRRIEAAARAWRATFNIHPEEPIADWDRSEELADAIDAFDGKEP